MSELIPFAEILLAVVIWLALRGGSRAAVPAPPWLRRAALAFAVGGAFLTVAPVLRLVPEFFQAAGPLEWSTLIAFLLVATAILLAFWIWLVRKLKGVPARSTAAMVLALGVSGSVIAVRFNSGFLSGEADAQNGVLIFVVPLFQAVAALLLGLLRRASEKVLGGKRSGGAEPGFES